MSPHVLLPGTGNAIDTAALELHRRAARACHATVFTGHNRFLFRANTLLPNTKHFRYLEFCRAELALAAAGYLVAEMRAVVLASGTPVAPLLNGGGIHLKHGGDKCQVALQYFKPWTIMLPSHQQLAA